MYPQISTYRVVALAFEASSRSPNEVGSGVEFGKYEYEKGLNTFDHSNHREDFVSYIELLAHVTRHL